MNSSISRWRCCARCGRCRSFAPAASNSITGAGRSKSIEPSRARRAFRIMPNRASIENLRRGAHISRWRPRHPARRRDGRVGHALGGENNPAANSEATISPFESSSTIALITRRSSCGFERADSVRELLGQHRHRAIRKINDVRAGALRVEHRAAANVVRNVGDVHLQLPVAVREAFDVHGSSKSRAVSPSIVTIGSSRKSRRPHALASPTGCPRRQPPPILPPKLVREMMSANRFRRPPRNRQASKNFDHASSRRHAPRGKPRQLHVDDRAIKLRQTDPLLGNGRPTSLAAPTSAHRRAGQ